MPALPIPTPNFLIDKLDEFLLEFAEHDQEISAGVAATGDAAAYAEVWEYGNARQTKPGPKTVLGTNPDGDMVWLSIQAPFGYISVHEDEYWEAIQSELAKVKFESTSARGITQELEAASKKGMKLVAQLIGDHAPVDTGALAKSFHVVEPGDTLLDGDYDSRTLDLGGE